MNPTMSAAGDRFNFGFFVDSDGIPTGKTRTQPTNGTSTNGGPLRFIMPKSVTPTGAVTPNVTVVTGEDGTIQHRYIFESDNTQLRQIQIAAQDLAMAGVIQNVPVNSIAGGRYSYEEIGDVQIPDMCLIIQSRSVRVSDGAQLWSGKFYPRVSLTYQGRADFTERGGAVFNYSFVENPTGYEPWGLTIYDNDAQQKFVGAIPFDNFPYPITMHAGSGDNSAVAFPVDYKPVSSAGAAAYSVSNTLGIRQPTAHTVSSVTTTAPYAITLSGAPSTGRRIVFVYQFRP